MEIIAEGLEAPEQLALPNSLGYGASRGYLFGKPSPYEQLDAVL